MNLTRKSTLALAAGMLALPAFAQITFYEHDGYRGRTFSASGPVSDFRGSGFNDRASSVVAQGGNWKVCENVQFGGKCAAMRPGKPGQLRLAGQHGDERRPLVHTTGRPATCPVRPGPAADECATL